MGKRSFLCRSSPGGSIIFPCPDHFVGPSVLQSNWGFRVQCFGRYCRNWLTFTALQMFSCHLKMVYCELDVLMKTVNCKVMMIENQHRYQSIRGHWGDGSRCRDVGAIRGCRQCQGCIWGLAGSVGAQGQQGYRGIRGIWAIRGCRGVRCIGAGREYRCSGASRCIGGIRGIGGS